jgi:hypothetical protein
MASNISVSESLIVYSISSIAKSLLAFKYLIARLGWMNLELIPTKIVFIKITFITILTI